MVGAPICGNREILILNLYIIIIPLPMIIKVVHLCFDLRVHPLFSVHLTHPLTNQTFTNLQYKVPYVSMVVDFK